MRRGMPIPLLSYEVRLRSLGSAAEIFAKHNVSCVKSVTQDLSMEAVPSHARSNRAIGVLRSTIPQPVLDPRPLIQEKRCDH